MLRTLNFQNARVVPLILAAGESPKVKFAGALVRFHGTTTVERAVETCRAAGLARPVVVIGCEATLVRRALPKRACGVINRHWRAGMMSSIRAGLRRVPKKAAVLLYPVDYPMLTPDILRRLARAFRKRKERHSIFSPVFRGRAGHPVLFAPEMRGDLLCARTARNVVETNPRRVKQVRIPSAAIWTDTKMLAKVNTRRGRVPPGLCVASAWRRTPVVR